MCVDVEVLERREMGKYLGATLSADGACEEEIEHRVGTAARVIKAMRKEVLERRELKRHESRLQTTKMAYLRRVEGVTSLDSIRNVNVTEALKQEEIIEKVRAKKSACKEKLEQVEDIRLVQRVYTEDIAGKRPRGRRRKKWKDCF